MTFNPLICQNCADTNIASIYPLYEVMVKNGMEPKEIFIKLGIQLQCCKTSYLAHIDYMKELEC